MTNEERAAKVAEITKKHAAWVKFYAKKPYHPDLKLNMMHEDRAALLAIVAELEEELADCRRTIENDEHEDWHEK